MSRIMIVILIYHRHKPIDSGKNLKSKIRTRIFVFCLEPAFGSSKHSKLCTVYMWVNVYHSVTSRDCSCTQTGLSSFYFVFSVPRMVKLSGLSEVRQDSDLFCCMYWYLALLYEGKADGLTYDRR
jgi:hypothetical protein